MGPPTDVILALRPRMQIEEFVETGTYRGETTAWAAEHFARVTTIELSPKFHAAAVERFRAKPAVRVLNGSSAAVLREIARSLAGPTLFWLDAHWSGLDTAGREAECPLLEEIAAINAASGEHAVLVDDARLFCAPPPRPHRAADWPDLAATVAALADGGRRYVALCQDVFIAVPNTQREFLSGWLADFATAVRDAEVRREKWWRRLLP